MPPPVLIEVPADREAVARQRLAPHDELDSLALAAPDGTVLDAREEQVLAGGRDLQTRLLTAAVARRVGAAEKRGPRSAPASAAGRRRTAGRRTARSSPPAA